MTKLCKISSWVPLKNSLMGKQHVHQKSNKTSFYHVIFFWPKPKITTHLVHLAQIFCPLKNSESHQTIKIHSLYSKRHMQSSHVHPLLASLIYISGRYLINVSFFPLMCPFSLSVCKCHKGRDSAFLIFVLPTPYFTHPSIHTPIQTY